MFDIGGDGDRADISRSLIDIFILWIDPNKRFWVVGDPQFIFDHESDREWAQIDLEAGTMMFGATSTYLRPSIGVGGHRTYDWSLEFGFKVIWR